MVFTANKMGFYLYCDQVTYSSNNRDRQRACVRRMKIEFFSYTLGLPFLSVIRDAFWQSRKRVTSPMHERDIATGTAMVLRVRAGIRPPDKGELRCNRADQG
jgi:hypothetical protein